jgi:ATP-dependent Clp protease ATP-binding subunit ClpB
VERDPALERRFQLVTVDPPSVEATTSILRGLRPRYEAYHGITISEGALVAAASLSSRYISGRHLPDKAIDCLDEAAAQVGGGGRGLLRGVWGRDGQPQASH